jgi:hypothetical protein
MARTVGTTMLGLTVGCARCHDHKYDPITNADYYRIAATFTTTVRSDYEVQLDPERYRRETTAFEKTHTPLVKALADYEKKEVAPKFAAWLKKKEFPKPEADWIVLVPAKVNGSEAVKLTAADDGEIRSAGSQFFAVNYTVEGSTTLTEVNAIRLDTFADPGLPRGGPGTNDDGRFSLRNVKITAAPAGKPAAGEPKSVEVTIAKLTATHDEARADVAAGTTANPSQWAIGEVGRDQTASFTFEKPVKFASGVKLTIVLGLERNFQGIGRFRLSFGTPEKPAKLDGTSLLEPARQALESLSAEATREPTKAERAALLSWFRTQDAQWRKLHDRVAASETKRPRAAVEKVLISSEGVPAVRLHTQGPDFYEQTWVLRRGDPNQKVEEAQAGFLQVLERGDEKQWRIAPPQGSKTSYRRTALAEWMTDVDRGAGNLLARVIVNRLWYHHFGRGLVATPSDFGLQGEKPSHPELLDYLACELFRQVWHL